MRNWLEKPLLTGDVGPKPELAGHNSMTGANNRPIELPDRERQELEANRQLREFDASREPQELGASQEARVPDQTSPLAVNDEPPPIPFASKPRFNMFGDSGDRDAVT